MRLLVTGACGYKGSVLVPKLLAAGHDVVALDIMWFGNYLPKHPRLQVLQQDVRDIDAINLDGMELIREISRRCDVAVGIVDVKSYYIETPEDIAARVRACLKHAPPEKLAFAPDCGLSQTARWAARQKLANMVAGVKDVRQSLRL